MRDKKYLELDKEALASHLQKQQDELKVMIDRKIEIQATIPAIEKQLKDLISAFRDLEGEFSRPGKIAAKQRAVADSEQALKALDWPEPVWISQPWRPDHRIEKVTAKRIYLLRRGDEESTYYSKADGTHCGFISEGKIDVKATLAAWNAYNGRRS